MDPPSALLDRSAIDIRYKRRHYVPCLINDTRKE